MRFLIFAFILISTSQIGYSQIQQSAEKWQEDLVYLQEKVSSDYPFLFKKISEEDFNKACKKLHDQIPGMESHEVMVGFAEIVASFGYGHTAIWLTAWRYNQLVNFHQMPYNLYSFTEGIYVQGVHKDYAKANGAKVLQVGNMPIEEAIEAIRPVVSAENDQFFLAHGLNYLAVPEVLHAKKVIDKMDEVILTLEKDGTVFKVAFQASESETFPGFYSHIIENDEWLDARDKGETPLWLKNLDKKYYMEYLADSKTVYVRQSEVQDEEEEPIPAFYSRVFDFIENNNADRLVMDLRLNSGGNNYKNRDVILGIIRCEKINQKGKLFVILGRRTFSACQNLVNELENYTEAIFIGEATAENVNFFGDNRTEWLPNSQLPVRLSYLWWQDKDPRDTRPWTPPHIAVDLSFEDYKRNHDPVMTEIMKTADVDIPTEPWTHITNLFMAGKMAELDSTAKAYVKDPKYKYYDFEDRFNDAGYQLMGIDNMQGAIYAFTLNTELYPDSPNCWDSLAEAYWRAGNKEKAKEYYKKAMAMDPDGSTGANAKEMLMKIEKEKD